MLELRKKVQINNITLYYKEHKKEETWNLVEEGNNEEKSDINKTEIRIKSNTENLYQNSNVIFFGRKIKTPLNIHVDVTV